MDVVVEGKDRDYKKKWRDWGALWGPHCNASEESWRTLEEAMTFVVGEKATNPSDQVFVGTFRPECEGWLGGINVSNLPLMSSKSKENLWTKR